MSIIDLSGAWRCEIPGRTAEVQVPGTLDIWGVGHPDAAQNQWHPDAGANAALMGSGVIATRLTRRHTYEGPARFTRRAAIHIPAGRRVFLEVERARVLTLRVNGAPVSDFALPTIATPHIFEVTGLLTGDDEIELTGDNSYPGLPRADILFSSAATDETQTNWNGLLGYVRLRVEAATFIKSVRVYPRGGVVDVCVELSTRKPWRGALSVESAALASPERLEAELEAGEGRFWLRGLETAKDARLWDEDEGRLYDLSVGAEGLDEARVRFGLREFTSEGGRLTLNGRGVFLRGEANCAVFPETGHEPMTVGAWTEILKTYRSYGVNCVRFHSHIPPEAAFEAADELGILLQPELDNWNPRNAFEAPESYDYYSRELEQALLWLTNHPSFVMLSFGNELHAGERGVSRMKELLALAHALDDTRLYAAASNPFYGQKGCDAHSDFFTAGNYYDFDLRATHAGMKGPLNNRRPDGRLNYAPAMAALREKWDGPVFSFEVGQYEVLPDLEEIEAFRGVTRPDNLILIRDRVRERGLEGAWRRRVEASGELALICYRAEVEAALRTRGLSGISLLGLQDFPGQGTALVGMLNSHLAPKPYDFARPDRFERFFRACLPLVGLERFTYEAGERLTARVALANYGKRALRGALSYSLDGVEGALEEIMAPCGGLTDLGRLEIPLSAEAPRRLELRVSFAGWENRYPIWVYPRVAPVCPEGVVEARRLDRRVIDALARGKTVYLSPDSDESALPGSIQAQFSTDFWSVGTFPFQSGAMGQLIDAAHPLFRSFPTDSHTDWQWWPMARQRAMIVSEGTEAIIAVLDSYATLRSMAQLLEARCGGGRVLVSSMGLHALAAYPEARALQAAIYGYLISKDFEPKQALSLEQLRTLVAE